MMLTNKHISVPQPQPAALTVQFVKPVSYEFRVAETVDENGKVLKVALQMQVWEHDEYGSGVVKQYWSEVPRVKFSKDGVMLPTI